MSDPHTSSGSRKGPWQPPDPEELQQQISQYKVLELLGQGGMGAVYKGWQVSLERYVAIKILPPDVEDGDAQFVERFKQEAKMMAKFMHPGIVAVFDAGETPSGLLYIVMEFVQGTDVAQMLKRKGLLDQNTALAITANVCDALHYAHARGVIHRDIKPANIMVNEEGVVKVADFGLAKASGSMQMGLTRSDMSMGTPDFIAPEALMLGVIADHRADLYAMGVMLYNMLTGEVPRGRFRPASVRTGCDARFDAIIDRAMEQDREHRYQSSQEIRRDLDVILTTPMEKAPALEDPGATIPLTRSMPMTASAAVPALHEPPPSRGGNPPAGKSTDAPKKSSAGLMAGVFAGVAALGIGAFLYFKKPTAPLDHAAAPAVVSSSPTIPATVTKNAPFVNSLGMKFVPVPMTSGPTKGQRVLFSIWETRVQDYEIFATETKRKWFKPEYAQGPTHPVVMVSWDDAQAFCQWLTERERKAGKITANEHYRLPGDHEWSCAAGIGEREDPAQTPAEKHNKIPNAFPWGSTWPPPPNSGNYGGEEAAGHQIRSDQGVMKGYRDDFPYTAPVGSFPADALGLFDLSGNAAEWCEDRFKPGTDDRVFRLPDFAGQDPVGLSYSYRFGTSTGMRRPAIGFRCVLSTVAADGEQWQDLSKGPTLKGLKVTPNGIVIGGWVTFPKGPQHDGAVRYRAAYSQDVMTALRPFVRKSPGAPFIGQWYQGHPAGTSDTGQVEIADGISSFRFLPGRQTHLAVLLKTGDMCEFELRVVGSRITVKMNGQIVQDIREATLSAGSFGISSNTGKEVLLQRLEVLDLDAGG